MGVPPWNGQRQNAIGFKPGLGALNLTLITSVPNKTNIVKDIPVVEIVAL